MALLKPERTEAQLRQQYGTVRELTELVVMDANIVDEDTREHVRTIGWHFEDYNPQTETWEAVPTLDAKLTKAQLCEQHDSIRNIKPVARLAEVAAATYGESAPDVEDFTMSPSEHTESHGQ